jgi:hypothetical protein
MALLESNMALLENAPVSSTLFLATKPSFSSGFPTNQPCLMTPKGVHQTSSIEEITILASRRELTRIQNSSSSACAVAQRSPRKITRNIRFAESANGACKTQQKMLAWHFDTKILS